MTVGCLVLGPAVGQCGVGWPNQGHRRSRQDGWRPKRTLVLCELDGEEPGLLGSTEWVEPTPDDCSEKAVSVPKLGIQWTRFPQSRRQPFASDSVIRSPPECVILKQASLCSIACWQESWSMNQKGRRKRTGIAKRLSAGAQFRSRALGSGSDYTPFCNTWASLRWTSLRGETKTSGIYHSIYDSFDHYVRFAIRISPTASPCQIHGHVMLRVAEADLLRCVSATLRTPWDNTWKTSQLADELRERANQQHRLPR